ncbi:MAG: hypothetical protein GWN67_04530 [Phycisphaerae bacterium]|nr:hypothetical protein [Phycisphaerae bacterium]NIP51189.1 hypothetical protein [Phycisphaerae bacterium]NIS50400.1 hypothetical protein [Phycisphaerae bacterium]NIU08130.1 hypothetical protein [Phycisphaerae bacterium]NIU55673.1 hypothetical protein [Phycisphaerae bacterium]
MDAKFFDSLYEGESQNGVKFGMSLTGGDFWPRVAGCSMLYRGTSMDLIDFFNILAVSEATASEISPPTYVSHDNDSIYFYVVRRVNECGREEHTLSAAVKVSIDSNGELAEPLPNNVFEIRAEQVDGDKILLVWYYCPIEQQSPPVCFKVYYDAGTGQIDYEDPIATISYCGRKFYTHLSDMLGEGKYLFAIRAVGADGTENTSLSPMEVYLDTTSPGVINILNARSV